MARNVTLPDDVRTWPYYPIEMPVTKDGQGPASVEKGEAHEITYEVWSRDFVETLGPFDNLPDAINLAITLSVTALKEGFYRGL